MDEKKFTYQDYLASDRVNQAQAALDQNAAQKPGDYQSAWMDQMNGILGQIQNRKPFQYDVNADALYNQYKDQYIRGGKLAMMDTMGQAAALTGGYGNSYAQQVGQQAYQGYLQGLNDKVPQLYQMALDQYNRQGEDLYRQYALLGDRENLDYGRYQDAMNLWMNDRNYWTEQAAGAQQFGYQQERDAVSDRKWQQQFDQALAEWEESKRQFDVLHPTSSGGSGGGGRGLSKEPNDDPKEDPSDQYIMDHEELAAIARIKLKNGASPDTVRDLIYKGTQALANGGSSNVANRIAYEMAKSLGVNK